MGDSWHWAGYLYEEDAVGKWSSGENLQGDFSGMAPLTDEEDHNAFNALKATSQADVMREKAKDSSMYPTTNINMPSYPSVIDGINLEPEPVSTPNSAPIVWPQRLSANTAELRFENIPNSQAMRVVMEVLPKVMELYLRKSRDYGGNVMELVKLGPAACVPDMLRKFGKIKRAVWDGEEMVGEQPDEIIMDLAGHIFIILDEMWKSANAT